MDFKWTVGLVSALARSSEGGIIAALCIITIIIGIIIIAVKKRKEDEDYDYDDTDSEEEKPFLKKRDDSEWKSSDVKPDVNIYKKAEPINQINVYSYFQNSVPVVCPYCDGENNAHDEYCQICGRKLR